MLRHRFGAREPGLARRAAILIQWHDVTKLTHSVAETIWGMRMAWLPLSLIAAGSLALACGGGLQPEPICARSLVGVCGTVRFRGTIPDSTDNVFIAAYVTFPQSCTDLINNRRPVIPGSVPYTDSIADY